MSTTFSGFLSTRVFVASATPGLVLVAGHSLAEVDAIAVAVTQFSCARDESGEIRVRDDRLMYLVTIACQNDQYVVSTRTAV
jgi:hypothetical protein